MKREPTYEELRDACAELCRSRDLLVKRVEAQSAELARLHRERSNVVPLRRKPTPEEAAAAQWAEQEGKPLLICNPDTGLYDIIVDNCAVYYQLDPIGLRNEIQRNAGREMGPRLRAVPSPSTTTEKP